MTKISLGKNSKSIENFLIFNIGIQTIEEIDISQIHEKTKIFLNGNWVGCYDKDQYLLKTLKNLRRQKKIPEEISIVQKLQNKEILIFTDQGRLIRPLLIVQDRELLIKKSHIEQLRSHEIAFSDLTN